MTLPLVSVIISNYNYATFIGECLTSVAAQDYPQFECIIVDDASSDGSIEAIQAWLTEHKPEHRFELVARSRNGGQMAALRSGIAKARGRFLAFVDADDLLLETYLSHHLRGHLDLPAVAMTACGFRLIDAEARMIGVKDTLADRYGAPLHVASQPIWRSPWWWSAISGAVFRRSAVDLMMTDNDEGFVAGADNYLCQAANLLGGSLLLPGHHATYRHHGRNNYGYLEIFGQAKQRPPRRKRRRADTTFEIRRHLIKHRSRLLDALSESHYWRMLAAATPPAVAFAMLVGRNEDATALAAKERRRLWRETMRMAVMRGKRDRIYGLDGRIIDLKHAPR